MSGEEDEIAKKELKGPIYYLIILMILTAVYIAVKTWLSSEPIEGATSLLQKLNVGIYLALVYFSMKIINRDNHALLCDTTKPKSMTSETMVPFLLVFLPIFLIINNLFIGWKKPFADTLGYMIISMFGYKRLFNTLFGDRVVNTSKDGSGGDGSSASAAVNEKIDARIKGILANTVNIGNLDSWIIPLGDSEQKSLIPKFKMLVNLKYNVSEFIWLTLGGLVMIMMMIVSVEDADKCPSGTLVD